MKRQPITTQLKEFREKYDLTQLSAARWCFLPVGTFRDYEQGRSEPTRIVEEGIRARIVAYSVAYEDYMRKAQQKADEVWGDLLVGSQTTTS